MFAEFLRSIVSRVEGSVGALIMGMDGIAVEQVQDQQPAIGEKLNMVAAAHTTLLRNSMRMTSDVGVGALSELTIMSSDLTLVMKLINKEYFLLIALRPDGNLGRARFELRKAQLQLEEEFVM